VTIDIDQLYRGFGPMVLRRCRRMLGNEEDALDAMQDTFIRLLKSGDTLTNDAPSSLLYRMATNVCLNRIRAGRSRPEEKNGTLLSNIAAMEDPEERLFAGNVLLKLFQREKESTRTLAVMHFLDRMTFEEVAVAAGMSVSGVRKRLAKLQTALEEISLLDCVNSPPVVFRIETLA